MHRIADEAAVSVGHGVDGRGGGDIEHQEAPGTRVTDRAAMTSLTRSLTRTVVPTNRPGPHQGWGHHPVALRSVAPSTLAGQQRDRSGSRPPPPRRG